MKLQKKVHNNVISYRRERHFSFSVQRMQRPDICVEAILSTQTNKQTNKNLTSEIISQNCDQLQKGASFFVQCSEDVATRFPCGSHIVVVRGALAKSLLNVYDNVHTVTMLVFFDFSQLKQMKYTVNDYRTIIGWFIRKSFVIFVYRKF